MSRGPVHPRAYAQLAAFIAAVLLVVAVVKLVRETAPAVVLDPVAEAAPDPENVVTCERTLPNAPDTLEKIAEVDPVGRVTSTEVIDCPDAFDRQVVTYVGEAVGDVLHRDDGAWVLLNDDKYALEVGPLQGHNDFAGSNTGLSVWLPRPLPDIVAGGPDQRGTILSIDGVIQRTDPADGGGLTLTALAPDTVRVVAEAQPVQRPLNRGQAVAAAVFATIAAAVVAIDRRDAARR